MTSESSSVVMLEERSQSKDDSTSKEVCVVSTATYRISQIWPLRLVMRAFRGFCWFFGFSGPERPLSSAGVESPLRTCHTGRKRLWRATRLLLSLLPCRIRNALGYPVCTSIGRTVCPEVQYSPAKPNGKGSKRKQDDVDDDEEEVEQQSWVDALNQEMDDANDPDDLDYEPTSVVTDSEEYNTHNDTESDIEVEGGCVVIKDVDAVASASASDSPDSEDPDTEVLLKEAGASDEPDSEDPDYEPGAVVTDSEEYHSHNNTEDMSDLEVEEGVTVIKDVKVPSGEEHSNGYMEFQKGAENVEKEMDKN